MGSLSYAHSGVLYRNVSANNLFVYVCAMTTEKDLRFSHAVEFLQSNSDSLCAGLVLVVFVTSAETLEVNRLVFKSAEGRARLTSARYAISIMSEMRTCPDRSVCIMGNVKQSGI